MRIRRGSLQRCGPRAALRRTSRLSPPQPASMRAMSIASTTGSPLHRASSPATARASTSPRRAPTRSMPSSTATLPAAAWGEKDGTVTNSERCISRQRAFLRPPERARPDWWMLSQVARRLGHGQAFAYRCAADIFEEHARLSGFENGGSRAFDISGRSGLSREAFDQLMPFQWPCRAGEGPTERLLGDGRFFTLDRKARFVAIAEPRLSAAVSRARPFVLNTGRIRDQWHTMTRTGLSPRLTAHLSEPFAEIHPDDAASMGLVQGALARVSTKYGAAVVRVLVNRGQQRGTLFVPIHWSAENSSGGRIGALVQPATDPYSGQPEAKATPARIAPLAVSHYGLALSRQPVRRSGLAYWAAA